MALSEQIIGKIKLLIAMNKHGQATQLLVQEMGMEKEEAQRYIMRLDYSLSNPKSLRAKGASKILAYIFLLAGIGILGLTAYAAYSKVIALNASVLTDGTVVSFVEELNVSYPVIEYVINDSSYQSKSRIGSNPPSYIPGETVAVYVKKHDPNGIIINSFEDKWLAVTLFSIFGLIVAGAGIIGLKLGSVRSKRYYS